MAQFSITFSSLDSVQLRKRKSAPPSKCSLETRAAFVGDAATNLERVVENMTKSWSRSSEGAAMYQEVRCTENGGLEAATARVMQSEAWTAPSDWPWILGLQTMGGSPIHTWLPTTNDLRFLKRTIRIAPNGPLARGAMESMQRSGTARWDGSSPLSSRGVGLCCWSSPGGRRSKWGVSNLDFFLTFFRIIV
jgi:hypothetical protein